MFRAERSQGDRARTAVRDAKKKEREAVAGGKKPFFLKGSEKKKLSLEQRCDNLYCVISRAFLTAPGSCRKRWGFSRDACRKDFVRFLARNVDHLARAVETDPHLCVWTNDRPSLCIFVPDHRRRFCWTRYEGLKEEGKLSKFMEKKRKKNAAKDHRWLPSKRQDRG